jgi:hypothetical protein
LVQRTKLEVKVVSLLKPRQRVVQVRKILILYGALTLILGPVVPEIVHMNR